jgi:dephospho-CoA kinase
MKILGLTGDIACGKSSVAQILQEKGVIHLDADLLVRELYADVEYARQLARQFGDILDEENAVSRQKLGALVFNNAELLRELEAVVHPAVAELREKKLEQLRQQDVQFVVLEAVKLLESGQGRGCDEIWCVIASPEVQMQRLTQNRGLSEEEAHKRVLAQPSIEKKIVFADKTPLFFIENNGTFDELKSGVEKLWRQFASI